MADFQTLNYRYSFGIQPIRPKFCVALVSRYDLLFLQDLEPLNYLFSVWIYPPLYTNHLVAIYCDNIKDWSIVGQSNS